MKAVFASLLISAVAAGAAMAHPQHARSTSGPVTIGQRCEAIAVEYRSLRAQGRLQGDVRREVLRRFHRTGCFGEPIMAPANTAALTAGRR